MTRDGQEGVAGRVLTAHHYYRSHLKRHPDRLFIFGDNMVGRGFGGQAKECRGEPNAVGIPTKWEPSMQANAFFTDLDYDKVATRINSAFDKLEAHIQAGGDVVWPDGGVGTGLADLPRRAPRIMALIRNRAQAMAARSGETSGSTEGNSAVPQECAKPTPKPEQDHANG